MTSPDKLRPVTMGAMEKFIAGLHDYLGQAFAPVNKRLLAMETRLTMLENQVKNVKNLTYRGVWVAGENYHQDNFVTYGGCVWACKVSQTPQKPGDGSDWQLAVKKGRDA